jgi:hypothetical protein
VPGYLPIFLDASNDWLLGSKKTQKAQKTQINLGGSSDFLGAKQQDGATLTLIDKYRYKHINRN